MACTPLIVQPGLFINTQPWEQALSKSFDGKSLTYNPGGPSPGLSVSQGGNNIFHALLSGHVLHYKVLGNKYLVILDVEGSPVLGTRTVSLVNFTTMPWTEVTILSVGAAPSVPLPVVDPSMGNPMPPGNGSVFLAFGQTGTQHTSVGIYRSDNGAVLCSLGAPIVPTGQTVGEATGSSLIIHYSTGGMSHQLTCPLPAGVCDITPASHTFPDVAVGGCPVTPPTRQFTIRNTGNDCLTISAIGNVVPFSVQATSLALPAVLAPNETMTVTVVFNPSPPPANYNNVNLPVTRSPANGDAALICSGQAVQASPLCLVSPTSVNFGQVPVGTSATRTLNVTNSGSAPLTVSAAPVASAGFTFAGFNGTLNCAQTQSLAIGFTPGAEGQQGPVSLIITSNSNNNPGTTTTVTLLGAGCVANAEINPPPPAPINFGQIQQGFRTVRLFEVLNTGDGPLHFDASISGADAALFGLPDPNGSVTVTPPTRAFDVNPVSPCGSGPSGTGRTWVAVSFFANDTPRLVNGAVLTLSGHNATNVPPTQTWDYPLQAEITPPIALDVALVVDRSGSMSDPLGSRVKMDAAISASQLFAELLRPNLDDRVALVRFNHNPEVVSPMTAVTPASQATVLMHIQNDVGPPDGNTAIAGGSIKGIREIQTARPTVPPALTKALVVLSDGIENTGFEDPAGSGNWFSILGGDMLKPLPSTDTVGTSAMSRPSDIDAYAIGLGYAADIDTAQLTGLASAAANFFHVDGDLTGTRYFTLEKYYTQIFMDIVGTSSILDPMYWINAGDTHEIEFDVLRGDVHAMVVIYDWRGMRLPFYCLSPKNEIVDPALIPPGFQLRAGSTHQARFVEFKMPPGEPDRYAGRWKVIIAHRGMVCGGKPSIELAKKNKEIGFLPRDCKPTKDPLLYGIAIGVGSNFRMLPFVTPGPVYVGEPIQLTALVAEAGLPVTGCAVTVTATAPNGTVSTHALSDDGAHGDGEANDGEYAKAYAHTFQAGTYHFHFRAVGMSRDGELVVREAVRDKPVWERGKTPPGGGGRPDKDECCEKLLKELREQRKLLDQLLKARKRA